MIGRFLEVSVQTADILESLAFYERLGFRQLTTGETWSHPYAVVSDGRLHVGLHQYQFPAPALTFVLADLARKLPHIERLGVDFAFRKTADDEFNEAGFTDPDGHMIALLEARTYSPPSFEDADFSACGRFLEYSLPARDVASAAAFWEDLGFRLAGRHDTPHPRALISGEDLAIGLHARSVLRLPTLTFGGAEAAQLVTRLHAAGVVIESEPPAHLERVDALAFRSPEGLRFAVEPQSAA